ncbi:cytochrome P450 27C1 [Petromyzon marinus]|uniref:cytochrome P450 27C1 n=1 Tax=Petromyzon marinus TaxID=7757 RepID=UPI003F715EA1
MRSAKALRGVLSKSRETAGLGPRSGSTSRLGSPRPLHSTPPGPAALALPQDEVGRRRGGGVGGGGGTTARKPRAVRDLPGPGFASNLVEFFWKDGFSRIHEIQLQQAHRFGAMWGTSFGPQFVVSLASPGLVAHVLRSEGPAPQRANMASWREYRALRGRANGLISTEGEEWLRMRAVLRQPLMRARSVWRHSEQINAIVEDVVSRVRCDRDERDGTVRNVNGLLFKFAMEGMASVLFERRLGCLAPEVPADTRDYIAALQLMFSMFKTTMYAGAIPHWLRPVLPGPWEDFCHSWDGLFRFSEIHVDARARELEEERATGGAARGQAGFLTEQLMSGALSRQELYANVTEMLLAGVDTTSFTMSWCLDLLARHPLTQEAVLREVRERGPSGGWAPSAEHVAEMPLLRGVLKETLRLYPVLPGNGRVTQTDMVLGGHHIPKGTQLAMCHYSTSHDPATFPQPESFRPERWLRDGASRGGPAGPHGDGSGEGEEEGEEEAAHRCPESAHESWHSQGFASIPFGYGVRSCIGRRVAELEIHLALARLLLEFRLEVLPGAPRVPAKTHGLLGPGGSIDLRFVDRRS